MKKAIGVVLFFSMLAAPALAGDQRGQSGGGQSGGGQSGGGAPRGWSAAPAPTHVFAPMPPIRSTQPDPVRAPIVNYGPPSQSAAPETKVKLPQLSREALLWNNYTQHVAPYCFKRHRFDVQPSAVYEAYNCDVNPYYNSGFLDTNL